MANDAVWSSRAASPQSHVAPATCIRQGQGLCLKLAHIRTRRWRRSRTESLAVPCVLLAPSTTTALRLPADLGGHRAGGRTGAGAGQEGAGLEGGAARETRAPELLGAGAADPQKEEVAGVPGPRVHAGGARGAPTSFTSSGELVGYNGLKKQLLKRLQQRNRQMSGNITPVQNLALSCLAGVVNVYICAPLWVANMRLKSKDAAKYSGVVGALPAQGHRERRPALAVERYAGVAGSRVQPGDPLRQLRAHEDCASQEAPRRWARRSSAFCLGHFRARSVGQVVHDRGYLPTAGRAVAHASAAEDARHPTRAPRSAHKPGRLSCSDLCRQRCGRLLRGAAGQAATNRADRRDLPGHVREIAGADPAHDAAAGEARYRPEGCRRFTVRVAAADASTSCDFVHDNVSVFTMERQSLVKACGH
ncbi:hypothetical protein ON010_g15698 [Phytophthora cinnamomi]|nr:hypothetical protein ON010_g15698 [Phytophthora cinnamomi]